MAGLVSSVQMLTTSAMVVPTGIISDKWSRKKTMIVSDSFCMAAGTCMAIAGTIGSVGLLFLSVVMFGLYNAFMSGTDEALMYETMTDLKKRGKYDIVYSGTKVWRYLGGAAATMVAVPVIYFYGIIAVAWVSVIPTFAQLATSIMLVEPKSYVKSERKAFGHLVSALGKFMRSVGARRIATIHMMNNSWVDSQYRFGSVYYSMFVPIWAVDLIVFIQRMCTSFGFRITMWLRRFGILQMGIIGNMFRFAGVGIGVMLNNIAAPFVIAFSALGQGSEATAESVLMQSEFSDSERATMRAFITILAGVFSALVYFVVGMIADAYSVHAAIAALLVLKGAVVGYYIYIMKFVGRAGR